MNLLQVPVNLVGVIIFGSVWFLSKNKNQINFFKKKKPKPVQTDRFRFGFLGQKPVQTGLARFFRFGSVFSVFSSLARFFSGFGSVFPVWLGFSGFSTVRFGFFSFLLIKPNRPVFSKF